VVSLPVRWFKLGDTIQREMVLSYMQGIATKRSLRPPIIMLHHFVYVST
jgi:hypothetical protein